MGDERILFRHIVLLKLPTRLTNQRQNKMIILSPLDQVKGSPGTQSVLLQQILPLTHLAASRAWPSVSISDCSIERKKNYTVVKKRNRKNQRWMRKSWI